MTNVIDLAKLRQRQRRDPAYTSREQIALDHADRIVLRVMINGEWKEKEQFPPIGVSLLTILQLVQRELRHSPDLRGVCLYIGGLDPNTGERMIASVPHEWIPDNVKRKLT